MTTETQAHGPPIEASSPRSFAIVFCVVFALIGAAPLVGGGSPRMWALAVSAVFLFFTFFFTSVLQPLNLLWFRFGMLLSSIINPLVMLVIFVVAFVPFGLFARLMRKDLLRMRLDPAARSYWIEREPPGPAPETIENQF